MGDELDEREIFVEGPVVIFKWRNAAGWPVEYASANAVEVFGHGADDFVSGRVSYGEVLHPDDAGRVGREVAAGTASGARGWAHEHYRVLHKDGSVRWLYDYTRVIRDAAGAATHYLGYVIDISERIAAEEEARELERRLLHAQKLESLGLLAGGVAHDFNNLLTGILGQASLARQQLANVPGEFRRALDQIEGLARRASGLTRQLLAYSGKGRFVIEPVDLGAVVRELAPMLMVVVPKAARLEVDADGPTVIMGDRSQVEQVVMNLITNAAEALDGGPGEIVARVSRIARADEPPQVVLEVRDTGRGMTAETVARVFDPFFTTKGAGRGLGMSAVLGIVRSHHGRIEVASQPGEGTGFRVEFPALDADVATASSPRAEEPDGPRGTVLVVDDEAAIRASVAAILGYLGYEVIQAEDGAAAVAIVERGVPITAALVDMTMPVLSGPDTAQALIRLAPDLAIVMTSGYSEEAATLQLGEFRVGGFLQKPFGLDELAQALARALNR
ncbi:MAG: response regulator [Myxococcales bacterium]|nr:response regulator [Myxococcales bacterium]